MQLLWKLQVHAPVGAEPRNCQDPWQSLPFCALSGVSVLLLWPIPCPPTAAHCWQHAWSQQELGRADPQQAQTRGNLQDLRVLWDSAHVTHAVPRLGHRSLRGRDASMACQWGENVAPPCQDEALPGLHWSRPPPPTPHGTQMWI